MTTIGGLLPLMFETSLQAQFLLPMAITIVFGLATATALVLVLVPALIKIGDDLAALVWMRRRGSHQGPGRKPRYCPGRMTGPHPPSWPAYSVAAKLATACAAF